MKNVLLITGPGGDAQGWGDMRVTECMRDALNAGGFDTTIAWIETPADFDKALAARNYDIVWSALYYITPRADIIGLSEAGDVWVADLLDERGVPYIGPSAQTMKNLIDKATTHRILLEHGVYVPANKQVKIGAPMPEFTYPAFVKPCAESRSVGISDASVVHSPEELERQVKYIHDNFKQAALVEEYLPGQEYTVLALGSGERQEILPGMVSVNPSLYGKYRILRSDLRGVGVTKISIPIEHADEARRLAKTAVDALDCYDHVRIDMRVDANDDLKIIEVNGIPGLKPLKSWSPQIYALYHPTADPNDGYRQMLCLIVQSALERHGRAG
ncbi:MAG: ATP-grasp domain-containing protein [Kiritimatiellia bacterium]|jgi:D-alanine-D-alanine ligase